MECASGRELCSTAVILRDRSLVPKNPDNVRGFKSLIGRLLLALSISSSVLAIEICRFPFLRKLSCFSHFASLLK